MRFEWDRRKAAINEDKHGVPFETAALVFDDPNCLVEKDQIDFETGEQRWHAVGAAPMDDGSIVLLVVHVYRSDSNEEIIRLISARTAGKHDVRRYQEQASY